MTSGPTYGQGFIELEPQLSRDFLSKINNQLDRAFSNIKLDVDTTSLREAQTQLGKIEGAADQAAKQVAEIAQKASASTDDFKLLAKHMDISEDEARRLATQVSKAQVETRQLDDAAQRVAKSMGLSQAEARRFADQMNRAADSGAAVSRLDTTIGNLRASLSRAAVAAVAFFGVRGVINQAQAARDAFIDLGESVNAVQVVFGDASDTIFGFSDQVAQSAGLARSEFQQMATVLGAALQNAGLDADEAAKKTIILTQRAADLASVFNTDVSEALGAIQAALRGEGDPIERFGVTLSAAAVDAEAAALGFSKVAGEFDSTAKSAARISLILEQTNRVAGDFANTSDSLANRQRILAAETENARAELGEALLPVFESLVEAGPAVVEGLKDMTPALASLAQSAADLAESTPGVVDFMDALHLLTDLPRGFGQIFDVIGALDGLAKGDLGAVGDAFQNTIERINTQGLIDDLREGEDAATALANRLAAVGRSGKISPEFIRNLRAIAGTDLEQSALALQALVGDAERLGLSAPEVALLNAEFARLRNELSPVGNEIAQAARAMAEELPRAASGTASALEAVRSAAGEAGISMGDLLAGIDPVAAALLESLTPAEELALRMDALASGTATAAEAFAMDLQPSLIDIQEGLQDLNNNGQVSLTEFTQSLDKAASDFLAFMVDIAAIASISPELAKALKDLGPDAVGFIADGFAKADEGVILAAAEDLLGSPEQIAKTFQAIYQAGLEGLDGADPAAIQAWLGVIQRTFEADLPGITAIMSEAFQPSLDAAIEGLDPPDLNPILKAAILEIRVNEQATAFQRVFDFLADNLFIDLSEPGRDSGRTYIGGILEAVEAREADLRRSVLGTLDSAIQRDSPPKLFLDAGKDSGDAFWAGFESRALDFPGIDLAKSFSAARAATIETEVVPGSAFGGPAIENVNFYDAREKPAEESLQEAGVAVAVMLNLRK